MAEASTTTTTTTIRIIIIITLLFTIDKVATVTLIDRIFDCTNNQYGMLIAISYALLQSEAMERTSTEYKY